MTDDELAILRAASADKTRLVQIVVTGCAYSCCGRGWYRRDGYEQIYRGWIDNFREPVLVDTAGTFMLYAPGVGGGLTYVIAVRFDEVQMVEEVEL